MLHNTVIAVLIIGISLQLVSVEVTYSDQCCLETKNSLLWLVCTMCMVRLALWHACIRYVFIVFILTVENKQSCYQIGYRYRQGRIDWPSATDKQWLSSNLLVGTSLLL